MDRALESRDESETRKLGGRLARACQGGELIFLIGDLGAGKSTFARGFIHALGYRDSVKSPTFTLVEPYELPNAPVYHFDLYRLADPEELEYLGVRDYLAGEGICLVEWPEKGAGVLPQPDIEVRLEETSFGRRLRFRASSDAGRRALRAIGSGVDQ
ncbi:MAG: tRNA (adenosine(37)-N6)-threonylcarbamoyltransferase complex ATPase subunit type 1 TsaE [Gammaproteobacteria bacterium]|nr:tRNA (adenosine(37)-N6)-threonylcarbamoyltransferase complex ATPase subunit type 1 TsaE [Gammaproteobacteria bacterium]